MRDNDVHLSGDRPDIGTHTFDVWVCPSCGSMYASVNDSYGDGCQNCRDIPEYYGEVTAVVKARDDSA